MQKRMVKNKNRLKKIVTVLIALWVFVAAAFAAYLVVRDRLMRKSYPREYSELVCKYSEQYGLSEELVFAVIRTESGFNPDAESGAGAQGLMQIMPDTKEWIEFRLGIEEKTDIFDPETNIMYGTFLLSYLIEEFEDEDVALAAYNAGRSRVKTWLADSRYSDDGNALNEIPYEETDEYVKKVAKAKEIYIKLYNREDKEIEGSY